MEKVEPMNNFSYERDGDKISYQWPDEHTLTMILNMNDGAEIRTYLFNESGKKTTLKINVDTAY